MIRSNTFRFRINISREGYLNKSEALDCLSANKARSIGKSKMAFKQFSVTIDEFLKCVTLGHTFCGLYNYNPNIPCLIHNRKRDLWFKFYPEYMRGPNKGYMKISVKQDAYFLGSQTVFIDIDDTRFTSIPDFIECLKYQPSCVYPSYSDGLCKAGHTSRRFHLVYIFDSILTADEFDRVSLGLSEQVEIDTEEALTDRCGTRKSQYFNGCYGTRDVYCSYIVYNKSDVPQREPKIVDRGSRHIDIKEWEERMPDEFKIDLQNACEVGTRGLIAWKMKYQNKFEYYWRQESEPWIQDTFQYVSDNYISLYWNKTIVQDGSHRRSKVFDRMCQRRIIDPYVTISDLIYCAVKDVIDFFDNSDGVFDYEYFIRNARSAMTFDLDDLEERYDYQIRNSRPKSGVIFKQGVSQSTKQKVYKEIRWEQIDSVFDKTKSINANLEILQQKGIKVSKSTLYRYCKSRKIKPVKDDKTHRRKTDSDDAKIYQLVNINISINKNLKDIRDKGYSVSKPRLSTIYKNKIRNNNILLFNVI